MGLVAFAPSVTKADTLDVGPVTIHRDNDYRYRHYWHRDYYEDEARHHYRDRDWYERHHWHRHHHHHHHYYHHDFDRDVY